MSKKLIRHGNSLALIIDKAIADALGLSEESEVDMVAMDDTLIVKPKKRKTSADAKKRRDITRKLMDKYDPVLKKLAKL